MNKQRRTLFFCSVVWFGLVFFLLSNGISRHIEKQKTHQLMLGIMSILIVYNNFQAYGDNINISSRFSLSTPLFYSTAYSSCNLHMFIYWREQRGFISFEWNLIIVAELNWINVYMTFVFRWDIDVPMWYECLIILWKCAFLFHKIS